jgi:hypothetical protein
VGFLLSHCLQETEHVFDYRGSCTFWSREEENQSQAAARDALEGLFGAALFENAHATKYLSGSD